ncbi:hypothetical protein SAMN06265365_10573 [Tistlia consotensis]|uniref:Uncharacterized protein n=1 Tax=Tistlia consotensis USBA 355 TaxID=560819 RepID=A0A1Y6BKI1_9PROT|nr:hypothetical protein [Tistlia consotensis]SMF14053.1 hypothetical protein SAMN05428998_105225 [Tistlia consotensis USBA 355]SNR49931.1 hypothetical protein SAMN06265365_10573 [Tistlia consotensis]
MSGAETGKRPAPGGRGAEQERLRERLQELDIYLGNIDADYGHSFRAEIERVRGKLEQAERDLEARAGDGSLHELWSSLSAEIHEIEARMKP